MRIIKIKNNTESLITLCGVNIAAQEEYQIQDEAERLKFATDSITLSYMNPESYDPAKIVINDGSSDLSFEEALVWLIGNHFDVNIKDERIETRTVNCQKGRKLHARYISFITASNQTFDNTGINNQDFGDVTYKMYKWVEGSRVETTTDSEAEETWIIFVPPFSYEICGGDVDVPEDLPVDQQADLDLWELHVAANMTLDIVTSGTVPRTDLIANPRAKFKKGKNVGVDSTLNPAEMPYNDPAQSYPLTGGLPYPTNEICLVVKHPAGKQAEFRLHLQLYK